MTQINSVEELQPGWKYRPTEVANLFPKRDPKFVRALCADGELEHVTTTGRAGTPNYWITGASVKAWLRRNTTKAA